MKFYFDFYLLFSKIKGKTLDGPPSSPPIDVRTGVINNTAAYVRWSPPPTNMMNGDLTGYKVILIFSFLLLAHIFHVHFHLLFLTDSNKIECNE